MAGAVGLAGIAALRSGAGLVQLAVPEPCLDLVASWEPSYMTVPLPSDDAGRISIEAKPILEQLIQHASSIGCGPGLGRSEQLVHVVDWLNTSAWQPVVFDADALNALAVDVKKLLRAAGPRVLTPHPGECRRLLGDPEAAVVQLRQSVCHFAREHRVAVVLKGHQSVISDGDLRVENPTGNAGMATGGSGDVLTGVITALLGQGLSPFDAARLGAYVHGRAGDLAAAELGEISLMASDLPQYLPAAFRGSHASS
jgi:NAD(P)H-hydrate epimerase